MSERTLILVVDDERDITDLLTYTFRQHGWHTIVAHDGDKAIELARQACPELIVLDIIMPGMDGFEVYRRLRQIPETASIPVLFLTARSDEIDQIVGLELGADDYVVKPISPRLLAARVSAILRRLRERVRTEVLVAPETIRIAGLELRRASYSAIVDGREVFFARKEFELLALLAANPGRVFSRQELLRLIWGESQVVTPRTVDVHITKIRTKLRRFAQLVETVKNVGYRFRPITDAPTSAAQTDASRR
ncbi:MAG: response regulator transcription factor [Candidatus Kapabacteria bacterium]|nr:response regulator transcription factor [Candidatus Kapabacteria bacterium]MCS7169294.1 response regulator transcription factor [Candidatus Kapabacteria bacterium]MDW7996116.1 response regulator transcription factor [Bacteroidota bacterium]MDW8225227.1 response regulator transcription factor [Bacteroidota bacterium]